METQEGVGIIPRLIALLEQLLQPPGLLWDGGMDSIPWIPAGLAGAAGTACRAPSRQQHQPEGPELGWEPGSAPQFSPGERLRNAAIPRHSHRIQLPTAPRDPQGHRMGAAGKGDALGDTGTQRTPPFQGVPPK